MHLALVDLFRVKWTEAIHEEWMRSVLENRPDLACEQLERTRQLRDAHARDCLVADCEDLIPVLTLPDPDDRHLAPAPPAHSRPGGPVASPPRPAWSADAINEQVQAGRTVLDSGPQRITD